MIFFIKFPIINLPLEVKAQIIQNQKRMKTLFEKEIMDSIKVLNSGMSNFEYTECLNKSDLHGYVYDVATLFFTTLFTVWF